MNINKKEFSEDYTTHAKSAYTAPQMEDVNAGDKLAFSLSPKKKHDIVDYTSFEIREREPSIWAKQLMCELKDNMGYCAFERLNVEAASSGRLHIHGWIIIKDVLNFYTQDILRLQNIGTYAIKRLFDKGDTSPPQPCAKDVWVEYMEKQSRYWKPYFCKYPFSSPNTNKQMVYPFELDCYCKRAVESQ